MKKELKQILSSDYQELRFELINELIQESINSIIASFRNNNFEFIRNEYNSTLNLLPRIIDVEIQNQNTGYILGRYIGFIEMISEVLLKDKKNEKIRDFVDDLNFEDIPHFNDIIITISKQKGINHQKLADSIGITKGTLSPIMDKLVESGLITFMRPGKFKYYYLTPKGEEYYKDKLTNIQRIRNKDALLEDLLIFIANSDNPSKCFGEINQFLFEHRYKSNMFKEKNIHKLDLDPLVSIAQIIKEQPLYISVENEVTNFEADEIITIRLLDGDQVKRHISFSNSKTKSNFSNDFCLYPKLYNMAK